MHTLIMNKFGFCNEGKSRKRMLRTEFVSKRKFAAYFLCGEEKRDQKKKYLGNRGNGCGFPLTQKRKVVIFFLLP